MAATKLFILLVAAFVAATAAEDVFFLPLIHEDGFQAHYHGSEERGEVTIHVYAATTGFVGFGVAPQGVMDGADLFIGGCHPDGRNYSGDYYGRGNSALLDTKQDVTLTKCIVNATITEIEWIRKYNTGDAAHDVVIAQGPIRLIWSLGTSDDVNGGHIRHGVATVTVREVVDDNGAWNAVASVTFVLLGLIGAILM